MGSTTTVAIDLRQVARNLQLPLAKVETVADLLDAGNTVPFITRYRKDQTGGLDEEQIRQIQSRLNKLRLLADRKQTILRSIDSQGKLTPELAAEIEAADSTKRLEDLYLPFKPKKQTLATIARERGLEPLAEEVLAGAASCADLDARALDFINSDKGVTSAADALLGVGHILAETFSERADLRQRLRKILNRTGRLVGSRGEGDEKAAQGFRDYFEYSEPIERVPPHRVLAINRGEKAKFLRVKVEADSEAMQAATDELVAPADHPHAEFLRGCGRDALNRLVYPSLEREVRREMTDWAENHAVEVFARNLRNLLLQPPVRSRRVLAVDPGFKSGCKLAALDEFGSLLDQTVIHLVGKAERKLEGRAKLVELIKQHQLSLVAIGNGTACRETEDLMSEILADELKDQGVAYVIVNEAGASVYSTSPLGREEFPEYDATLRGAISIGRRLQDPLSELVKIDPASIGVGLYQHDVKAKHLRASLDAVVESCVNFVGVDLNTASPALLRYVSGLNQLTARRVYDFRSQHGPILNREQLKEVPGFGEATFIQSAGFLKITGGDNPLDATWIHPESYEVAQRVLEQVGASIHDLTDKEKTAEIEGRAASLELQSLTAQLDAGELLLKDILTQLFRPGRDPREDLPPPIFKKGVIKLDDLSQGMELTGTVLNVVDFGAFVDIGLHDTGLVHISQLANKYVRDPHEVVSVGDIVKVWVHEIDKERRRVSLTMIAPGSEKPAPQPRRGGPPRAAGAGEGRPKREGGPPRKGGRRPPAQSGTPAAAVAQAPPAPVVPPPPPKPPVPDRTPRRPDSSARNKQGRPGQGGRGGPGGGGGGRPGPGGRGGPPSGRPPEVAPVAPPKPTGPRKKIVTPQLTPAMKVGKEPLRTFGDLKQLFELKTQPAESPEPVASPQPEAAAPAQPPSSEQPPAE